MLGLRQDFAIQHAIASRRDRAGGPADDKGLVVRRRRFGLQPTVAEIARLMRLVEPCAVAMQAARAEVLTGTGVGAPEGRLMALLADFGPAPVPRLADTLGVTRQAVQPLVDALVEAGQVELLPNAAKRRSPLVRLTEVGRAAVTEIQAGEAALHERVAARFLASDVAITRRTLENLIYAYSGLRAWEVPRLRAGWSAAAAQDDRKKTIPAGDDLWQMSTDQDRRHDPRAKYPRAM